jgi:hypothetical protein
VYNHEIANEMGQKGVIVYRSETGNEPSTVQAAEPTAVDYQVLKSWLTKCEGFHEGCAKLESPQGSLSFIYLIDCVDLRVVRARTDEQYLALSYVWGKPGLQTQDNKAVGTAGIIEGQFKFGQAPLTIQDAICVVRKLDRRYLWVDKYCIKQEGGAEKELMLRNMDHIYDNAEATIVALYGENDEAGLPGVSRVPRTPQPRLSMGSGYLISSLPSISAVLADSRWITRGWTYQEARCSRRCLFFTQYQTYFVCRKATMSETVPSSPTSYWVASILNSHRLNASLFAKKEFGITDGLFMDRLMFSQRHLTHPEDVLDTFRGILSRSPFIAIWGVPVIPVGGKMDPCVGLALGLLWVKRPTFAVSRHVQPTRVVPYTRRPGFPTWSWTSIVGEIYNVVYENRQSILGDYLGASTEISATNEAYLRFWLPFEGQPTPLQEVIQRTSLNVLSEQSPDLLVEGDILRVRSHLGSMSYLFCGQDNEIFESRGLISQFDFPSPVGYDTDGFQGTVAVGEVDFQEALVLIQWNDSQK